MFKKFSIFLTFVIFLFCVTGCDNIKFSNSSANKEQPHLYWKDIDAVVTEVNQKHWFATTHHYVLDVTVYSEEYNLTKILTEQGSGAFGTPEHWSIQKGDTVKVRLHSWVMDSTGEVTRREIHDFVY